MPIGKNAASGVARLLTMAAFILTGLLGMPVTKLSAISAADTSLQIAVPEEYGRVIYQEGADRPNQIYIIAQSHRSAVSGHANADTVHVQAEIFRLGEWLVREQGISVLFPEGYFQRDGSPAASSGSPENRQPTVPQPIDDMSLLTRLADPNAFVNADMLLRAQCGVRLQQVEDRALYHGAVQLLQQLSSDRRAALSPAVYDELEYLQRRRSAAILERIPAALSLNAGAETGAVRPQKAITTIGLAHVHQIVAFLEQGQIEIPPPQMGWARYGEHNFDLQPLKAEYGVTIILPRTLAENQEILQLARLI